MSDTAGASLFQPREVAGIDASTGGWFATMIKDGTVNTVFDVEFETIIAGIRDIGPILVDVPIGLPTETRRACDIVAMD